MLITNNHNSFHLWRNKNLVKHQKVSKYYDKDCTKNPDCIKQLESCQPKGDWYHFDSTDIRATEIIQKWKQVSTGKHISIRHFCRWGMKKTMKKKHTVDNCKSALNIVPPVVQDYLSLTEKNFAKDDIINAHNTGMGRLTQYNSIL